LGFRFQESGFRNQVLGIRFQESRLKAQDSRLRILAESFTKWGYSLNVQPVRPVFIIESYFLANRCS